MTTLHCNRDEAGDIRLSATANLGSVSPASLKMAHRQLKTLQPRPLDFGFPKNGDAGTTTCSVTIHGHTSNDGIFNAIKAFGFTLSPLMSIDDIDVSGLAQH